MYILIWNETFSILRSLFFHFISILNKATWKTRSLTKLKQNQPTGGGMFSKWIGPSWWTGWSSTGGWPKGPLTSSPGGCCSPLPSQSWRSNGESLKKQLAMKLHGIQSLLEIFVGFHSFFIYSTLPPPSWNLQEEMKVTYFEWTSKATHIFKRLSWLLPQRWESYFLFFVALKKANIK